MSKPDKPIRIQRKRTKGWVVPGNTIYVGRPTIYGNPFKGKRAVALFISWLDYRWGVSGYKSEIAFIPTKEYRERLIAGISKLKGKNLCCWCKESEPCHADVLLELANR